MSKFGPKTYSRRSELKSNVQFDQLFSDNKNKPSTAKVSAGVQRWGVATFTSIRKTQLNGQKEHEDEEESKRFKTDSAVGKGRMKSSLVEDPFSFDVDKDTSPVKKVRPIGVSLKSSAVVSVAEKKTKPTYSKPNKFFKSGGRSLSVKDSLQVHSADVLEKCVHQDRMQERQLRLPRPQDIVTTQPTVVKLLSPTKTNVEDKRDNIKPSAFDLLLAKSSSVVDEQRSNSASKREPAHGADDWFSVFDNCKNSVRSKCDAVNEEGSDFIREKGFSERTECDSFCNSEETRLSELPLEDSSSTSAGRTYSRGRNKAQEMCEKRDLCPSEELTSEIPWQDNVFRSQSPDKTLCLQAQESEQHIFARNDDGFASDSSTPCFSQEVLDSATPSSSQELSVSSREKQDAKRRGDRTRLSIFKSRNSQNKKKAVYKHRPWQDDDKEEMDIIKDSEKSKLSEEFEDEIEKPNLTLNKKVTQRVSYTSRETIVSWKCDKKAKELYTVVHNVKQAYQCHESGETQEFNDEVEYLLEGIQPKSSLGTRCLSTVGWATKCMLPSFRIHLRAHGTIPRVFSALMDAPNDSSLSLCTATLMFVLSQDRLTMDLEANTLSLMLRLLEAGPSDEADSPSDSQHSETSSAGETIPFQQASKMKEKVRQLCEEMQQKGYAKQLNLENITTGNLAMETLLSLTSRKAGEWFKEGIRNLGGLDYIVDTVNSCTQSYWLHTRTDIRLTDSDLSELKKIDRCLRVLENVTYMNADNQIYLLNYKNAVVVECCFSMLQACRRSIAHNPIPHDGTEKSLSKSSTVKIPGFVLLNCILSLLKVLLNLTHESGSGSSLVGSREGLLECILLCILQVPQFIPHEDRFDLLVLALGLLINLMEQCEENRNRIAFVHTVGSFDSPNSGEELSALEALVEVFLGRVDAAKQSEEQADALLDPKENQSGAAKSKDNSEKSTPSSSQQSQAEELEETLMKALQKAGKNMEHSIIAAYIALLLGCIIQNKDYADLVRDHMPNGNFNAMVEMLRKFLNFVSLTGVVGTTGLKSIQKVLQVLESS